METQQFVTTRRLRTAYYHAGKAGKPKLLMLHGNMSSSVFFLPLIPWLEKKFDILIPDMRCFGDTQERTVDATRGYRDWSDDIKEFVDALGWKRFSILGWSMGGNVAMQFSMDHTEMVERLVLVAPGSPFGFGGTRGKDGQMMPIPGLASGGGCANPQLVSAFYEKNRSVLRQILNEFYFNPPFRMSQEWEERLLDAMCKLKIGAGMFPGNYRPAFLWPFVAAGDSGVLNAMSSLYGNVSRFVDISPKPDILWVRGQNDRIVSDCSFLEFGALGSMGIVPGWPGNFFIPPQPMVAQTRYVLDGYAQKGGSYEELVIPGGHMCCLESPDRFVAALCAFFAES